MWIYVFFFFSSRRRHTRWTGDWSSDVCSSDLRGGSAPCSARPRSGQARSPSAGSPGRSTSWSHRAGPSSPARRSRSEERRVGKSVDLGGRRRVKKKIKKKYLKDECLSDIEVRD